jgi:multidrug efflux pump subunit AcrB
MRKIIEHFIKYPVAANVLILSMVVLGTAGIFTLNSSFFPLNESRNISISVAYPGASPQEMEEGIVLKIEDNLRGLVGIDRFTSTSSENSAQIMVEVIKGYNVDAVLQDIKNAVDRVPSYPVGMEPPVISKMIFRTEAVSMALHGEDVSLRSLKQLAREIETDLRSIDGISQVEIGGFPSEEIEIAVDENKLRAYDLTFREVANAVSGTNILMTGGSIKTETEEFLIRVSNRAYYGVELDYLIIKSDESGNKVRLIDVAEVADRWNENPKQILFQWQTIGNGRGQFNKLRRFDLSF